MLAVEAVDADVKLDMGDLDTSLDIDLPPKSSGYSSLTLASTDVALKNLDNYLDVEADVKVDAPDVKVDAPDAKIDVEPVSVSSHSIINLISRRTQQSIHGKHTHAFSCFRDDCRLNE